MNRIEEDFQRVDSNGSLSALLSQLTERKLRQEDIVAPTTQMQFRTTCPYLPHHDSAYKGPVAENISEIIIEANNDDLLFKSGITASISIRGTSIKAHKISPSILTLQDDGSIGVKAIDEKNTVIFYPIKKEIDTIDGMWVSGLPNEVKIIITGQEYVTVGQVIQSE